jgi:acyloxyacyl hydrolase
MRVFDSHEPLQDFDGDFFSGFNPPLLLIIDIKTFRGSSWRGKDCNDFDKNVYPGRRDDGSHVALPTPSRLTPPQPSVDANCNGIFGADKATGVSLEKELCGGTQPMGTILLWEGGEFLTF